ncbi:hypothetical protein IQ07DRAFT_315973 [Pyrenochaeta sp. DS3sAY3a]|nr:hypothetical protein IQ07DRAFT_315973 [Pyrenochaeta sp. DS3sAY3a]
MVSAGTGYGLFQRIAHGSKGNNGSALPSVVEAAANHRGENTQKWCLCRRRARSQRALRGGEHYVWESSNYQYGVSGAPGSAALVDRRHARNTLRPQRARDIVVPTSPCGFYDCSGTETSSRTCGFISVVGLGAEGGAAGEREVSVAIMDEFYISASSDSRACTGTLGYLHSPRARVCFWSSCRGRCGRAAGEFVGSTRSLPSLSRCEGAPTVAAGRMGQKQAAPCSPRPLCAAYATLSARLAQTSAWQLM